PTLRGDFPSGFLRKGFRASFPHGLWCRLCGPTLRTDFALDFAYRLCAETFRQDFCVRASAQTFPHRLWCRLCGPTLRTDFAHGLRGAALRTASVSSFLQLGSVGRLPTC